MSDENLGYSSPGRTYTQGRKHPYVIRKLPGSQWALPLGPYTLLQITTLAVSAFAMVKLKPVWAIFGPLQTLIMIGVPIGLTYAVRHTRIEGRDPVRSLVAWAGVLFQSKSGYLADEAWHLPKPVRYGGVFPVVALPAREPTAPAPRPVPTAPPAELPQSIAQLLVRAKALQEGGTPRAHG